MKRLERSKPPPPLSAEEKLQRQQDVRRKHEERKRKERSTFLSRFERQTSSLCNRGISSCFTSPDVIVLVPPKRTGITAADQENQYTNKHNEKQLNEELAENEERNESEDAEEELQTTTTGATEVFAGNLHSSENLESSIMYDRDTNDDSVHDDEGFSDKGRLMPEWDAFSLREDRQPQLMLNEDEAFDLFIEQNSIL